MRLIKQTFVLFKHLFQNPYANYLMAVSYTHLTLPTT